MNKRSFLKHLSLLGLSTSPFLACVHKLAQSVEHLPAGEVAQDEAFWNEVRGGYKLKPDYINLENGYYCMMPEKILEEYLQHLRRVNLEASYYMRNNQYEDRDKIVASLAEYSGVAAEELCLTRNTTESLDLVIGGQHWQAGDEAVMAEQDYGAMLNMFRLQEERYGIKARRISLPNHPKSDEEIVALYQSQINDKTKLLMVPHMVNINGQVLPVKKIADMAHACGVKVMVDGAHSFAHLNFKISDLGCDYFGASLHKWLSAPLGAGLLWVKKENIAGLWPLFAEDPKPADDIARINHTGTVPVHTNMAIANALAYHLALGPARKEARLRYLQRYWTTKLRGQNRVILNTSEDPQRACAIANVGVEGIPPKELAKTLLERYRIWTVAIDRIGVQGCRITPNLFSTTKELDALVNAISEIARV